MAELYKPAIPARFRAGRWAGLAMLAGALGALPLVGCNRQGQAKFVMPSPRVTTADVTTADVPVYLDEIGKTVATEVVNVLPEVSGQIMEIHFKDGADLKKNDVLFVIDTRPYMAQVASAEAALEQNRAQVDYAKKNFDRIVSLMPTKAVAQTDYDTAKNAVDVGEANVKASQAALDTANLNLAYCTIKSPIDGRAGQRLVDVGNVVTANFGNMLNTSQSSLLGIQKIAPIYVDFTIAEGDLPGVRANMDRAIKSANPDKRFLAVEVENPDGHGKPLMGKLTFLDNAVQDGTGTIKLRATVDNADMVLWPGQFVRVRLILKTQNAALLVPNEAIQIGQQGSYVFTISPDQTAQQKPVTVGQRQGNLIVVETGLDAGDRVVTTGQLMLMPGVKVELVDQKAGEKKVEDSKADNNKTDEKEADGKIESGGAATRPAMGAATEPATREATQP